MQLRKPDDVERIRSILADLTEGQLSDDHRLEIEAWLANSSNVKTGAELTRVSSRRMIAGSGFKSTKDALGRLDASDKKSRSARGVEAYSRSVWEYIYIISGLIITLCIAAGVFWLSTSSLLSSSEKMGIPISSNGPYVLVSFDEQATITEVTQTLQQLGLGISAGPLSGGVYRVDIPSNTGVRFDELSSQLQTAPSVMWLVSGLRPGD